MQRQAFTYDRRRNPDKKGLMCKDWNITTEELDLFFSPVEACVALDQHKLVKLKILSPHVDFQRATQLLHEARVQGTRRGDSDTG